MDGILDLWRPANENLAKHTLAAWSWLLRKNYTLIGTSLFGDAFLKDDNGLIDMLDLVHGEVRQVAFCIEEFEFELESNNARNEWLMEPLARHLMASGLIPGVDQCYAFQTPPALGGQLKPQNVLLWDIFKYHSGLSSVFRQISGMPPGTQIVIKPTTA